MKKNVYLIIAAVLLLSNLFSFPSYAYKYSYGSYRRAKERAYDQYQREKEASYERNRGKSYEERRADYDAVHDRGIANYERIYQYYHDGYDNGYSYDYSYSGYDSNYAGYTAPVKQNNYVSPNIADIKAVTDKSLISAVYDENYYLRNNPDVKEMAKGDSQAALQHFINFGMKEGRSGNAEFNVAAYRANYPDLAAAFGDDLVLYYQHYVNLGKVENRIAR